MRQAGLGGRPAGRTSALCFGERPQRPAGPRHQPGLGSDPDSARGFSVRHLERPAGAAGRDPGCVRRSSGSRSAHACVRSPASARTPSRLQTCPCALPPPRQHSGWKQGWGAGLSPQPPGPAAPSRGLLSLAACVQGFGASLELPRGGGGRPVGPPGHPGMADQAGVTLGSPGAHTWSSRPPWSPHISDRVDCCALAFGEKAPSPTKEGHGGGGRTVWDQRWVPCLALGSLCDPKVTLPHTVHCFLTNTMVAPRACPGSPISCPQGSG